MGISNLPPWISASSASPCTRPERPTSAAASRPPKSPASTDGLRMPTWWSGCEPLSVRVAGMSVRPDRADEHTRTDVFCNVSSYEMRGPVAPVVGMPELTKVSDTALSTRIPRRVRLPGPQYDHAPHRAHRCDAAPGCPGRRQRQYPARQQAVCVTVARAVGPGIPQKSCRLGLGYLQAKHAMVAQCWRLEGKSAPVDETMPAIVGAG